MCPHNLKAAHRRRGTLVPPPLVVSPSRDQRGFKVYKHQTSEARILNYSTTTHQKEGNAMGRHIDTEGKFDRTPDPDDMTYTEAQICDKITNCGNEIDMVDGTVRLLVQQMLTHWGFASDQTKIQVRIVVSDIQEAVTWIDHPRERVNFGRIKEHVFGLNANTIATEEAPHWVRFARGGEQGMLFSLTLEERDYEDGR